MQVITAFFDADNPLGHVETLRNWRYYVTNDSVYQNERQGPSTLVHDHELNVRLLEAALLLSLAYRNGDIKVNAVTDEQISMEKAQWEYDAGHLSVEEVRNPYLAIWGLFETIPLQQYRDLLYEWLTAALCTHTGDEDLTAAKIITVYDNLLKLYDAAWVLYKRNEDNHYQNTKLINADGRKGNKSVHEVENLKGKPLKDVMIYTLDNFNIQDRRNVLTQVIEKIRYKVPLAEAVFYLGAPPDKERTVFLLTVVSPEENRTASELADVIENSCQPVANVTTLIIQQPSLERRLARHDLFYEQAVACTIVYLSGKMILPAVNSSAIIRNLNCDKVSWQRWYGQAEEFLKGAEYHLKEGAYKAALFSLHQAAEAALIAIVEEVTGYRPSSHNLSRLFKLTEMFTGCISREMEIGSYIACKQQGNIVTEQHSGNDRELFELLKNAYVGVRYKECFDADEAAVKALVALTTNVLKVILKVYQVHCALCCI